MFLQRFFWSSFGQEQVIVVTQLLYVPTILGFVQFPGVAVFAFGALFRFLSDSSLSVTLSAALRLMPGRTGIASGVIFGLGFITSGIGVLITDLITDHTSIEVALTALTIPCLAVATIARLTDERIYREPDSPGNERASDTVPPTATGAD